MKGAREYYDLFVTGTYGKLYIQKGSHARGKTFHIYVLPEGVNVDFIYHCKDAVEVYGVIRGNPGWTEEYGWLHIGKWIVDFDKLVEKQKKKKRKLDMAKEEKEKIEEKKEAHRAKKLLDQY